MLDKSNVKLNYKTDNPEGSAASDRIWVSLMGTLFRFVKHYDRYPEAWIIVYANNITIFTSDNDKLQTIFKRLSMILD